MVPGTDKSTLACTVLYAWGMGAGFDRTKIP